MSNSVMTIENIWENDFVLIGSIDNSNAGFAKAKQSYIPIESFKTAFGKAYGYSKERNWKKFIFDKSNLNVFHQPSMEWYYTNWKKDLVDIGLTKHYKILPNEDWFKSSVKAGIAEIKLKYPEFDFNQFTVDYINKIEEAI